MRLIAPLAFFFILGGVSLFAIGMRHNLDDAEYRKAGRNEGPYAAGKNFPDFAPVCAVAQSFGRQKKGRVLGVEALGSGVLIGPRFVLTASHVVITESGNGKHEKRLQVHFGPDLENPRVTVRVARVHTRFPAEHRLLKALGEKTKFGDKVVFDAEFSDIALLELDAPITEIEPARLPVAEPVVGERVVVAGFGDAGFGDDPKERNWEAARYLRAAENRIDRDVTRNPVSGKPANGGLIMMDFDNGNPDRNTLNGAAVRGWEDLIVAGKSEAAPLPLEGIGYPGDSGGPAFVHQDGAWRVAGVCGYGTGFPAHKNRERIQYGDISVYTRVFSHLGWILKVSGAAVE